MIRNFFSKMMEAHANRIGRNAMTHMSDRMLADIGLTRDQATDDALHGIWDAPKTWTAPSARDLTPRLPRVASIY